MIMKQSIDEMRADLGLPPLSVSNGKAASKSHAYNDIEELKSNLAKTKSSSSASPKVKGLELAKGRTAAKVRSFTNEFNAARITLGNAERILVEVMGEGLDITDATEALKTVEDRVRSLDDALTVATQKDQAAAQALKAAQMVGALLFTQSEIE
jgi:hypothetical protein